MARITPTTITGQYASIDALNANFVALAAEFEKCIYRDGTATNSWTANQDANSKKLLNLPAPLSSTEPVRLSDVQDGSLIPDVLVLGAPSAGDFIVGSGGAWAKLTSAQASAYIDHGSLAGLADDDHTQYSLVTGTRAFSGAVTITAGGLTLSADHLILGGGATASELRFKEPSGSGANYTAFKAQAQAGDVTYTLPAADATVSGQVLSSNAAGVLSWITAASGGITMGTPVTLTNQTSVTFGSIPAGTKRIKIFYKSCSTAGADDWLVQLGDAGGIETSGYEGRCAYEDGVTNSTALSGDFRVLMGNNATRTWNGVVVLDLVDSSTNTWMCHSAICSTVTGEFHCLGSKSLSAELTQVKLLFSATDNFDAGVVNISYT